MSILRRKLWREVYQTKWLLLTIASIIVLGIMCFIAMRTSYGNLTFAKSDYYVRCRMADFWIDCKKLPLSEVDAVREIPGIAEVRARISFLATLDLAHVNEPLNVQVVTLPDQRKPVINDIVMTQGRYFSDRKPNEVIVSAAFARAHNLKIGATVHLLMNDRRQPVTIVGTAISSEFIYLLSPGTIIPDPAKFGVFFIKQSFGADVFDFDGVANQLVGRTSATSDQQLEVALRQAEERLEPYGVVSAVPLKRQVSNQFLSSEIDGLGAFAAVIPPIFLAVAALVLNVLLTRMARQQRTVVGTLKALGYADRDIFMHFMLWGLIIGVVGGVVGDALGYLSAYGMTFVYRQFFEFPRLPNNFFWGLHLLGLTVSIVCALLGSAHGAITVLRLQPAASMRPEPPRRAGAILLEHWSWLWSRLGSGWRMALRNLFRHRVRSLVGVFAAAMGVGLLTAGLMLIQSQHYLLTFQFELTKRSDIEITLNRERGEAALDELRRLPSVDRVEPIYALPCTLVSGQHRRKTAITGLTENARLTLLRSTSTKPWIPLSPPPVPPPLVLPASGLVISTHLATVLHVRAGESLTLIPVRGDRQPVEVKVVRVVDNYLGATAYADIHYLSRLVEESFVMNAAQLLVDTDPAGISRLQQRLKTTPAIQSVIWRKRMIQGLQETVMKANYLSIGMISLFAGAILFGSILNASMVNLAERQQEVATLRAIGYGPWRIGNVFLRESLLVNSLGLIAGIPFGMSLVMLVVWSYNSNDLFRFPAVGSSWIWFATAGVAGMFTWLAHLVVQAKIHRLDFLESLKVKE